MTIYAKTNAGRLLAFDNSQALPAAMREFLRRVDGKTTRQQLLSHPGDKDMLEELLQRQWVQVVSAPWRNSTYSSSQTGADDAYVDTSSGALESESDIEQFAPTEAAGLDSESDVSSSLNIRDAKLLMCDFVASHMPEHYEALVNDILEFRDRADLLTMLNPYIDLANSKGKLGQQHVQQLLAMVAGSE